MTASLLCPQCKRELREECHRDIRIDTCECGGIWFDRDELEAWLRAGVGGSRPVGAAIGIPGTGGPYRCPRCASDTLDSRIVDDVPLWRCRPCGGVWVTRQGMTAIHRPDQNGSSGGIDFVLSLLSWL